MTDLIEFGRTMFVISAGLSLALAGRVLSGRLGVPSAALLLLVAAIASDLSHRLAHLLTIREVQNLTTVALIVILFDGGMSMGLRRFRGAATPILVLGLAGTFATAALVAGAAHVLLGLSWIASGLLGAAVAPTDPAVTFSVLAGREVHGNTATILEGESGFNDPAGIALMIGFVELATHPGSSFTVVIWDFLREMTVGLAIGVAAGVVLSKLLVRLSLPDESLFPIALLVSAGLVYGGTSVAHGSGFLAVFVAGIAIGDIAYPQREPVLHFHSALAALGELVVFIALGLTVDLGYIFREGLWWRGLVTAVLLGFVIRPLVVGGLLVPFDLTTKGRIFLMWSGLKGAVPILLASMAVAGHTAYAAQTYGIVFVVVLFSVAVQGSLVPLFAD
jgi:cell volume regulation protein A